MDVSGVGRIVRDFIRQRSSNGSNQTSADSSEIPSEKSTKQARRFRNPISRRLSHGEESYSSAERRTSQSSTGGDHVIIAEMKPLAGGSGSSRDDDSAENMVRSDSNSSREENRQSAMGVFLDEETFAW